MKMRGSIYFLKSKRYNSVAYLRRFTDYERKTPIEFYNIIHKNYLAYRETIRKTNEKKQGYYKKRRLERKREKIKRLKAEIKELENDM